MIWLVRTARTATTTLMGAAAILGSSNALTEPVFAAQGGAQSQLSFTCRFDNGPRAGQSASYAGVSGPPIPVGVPCSDGQGSTGVVIPEAVLQPVIPVPAPPPPAPPRREVTFICRFDNGPRAGQAQNYAGVTGIQPFPVGLPCTDGQGSTGVAIPEVPVSPPPPPPPLPATTFSCRFDTGSRAGQVQSYAGVTGIQPIAVGAPCTDGQGSTGVAVPEAPVQAAPPVPTQLPPPPEPVSVQPQPPAPPPPPPPPPPRPVRLSPNLAARSAQAMRSAAVGAPVPGLRGAVWADPKNTGYVTGYSYNGRYHRGAPPGFNPGTAVAAVRTLPPPAGIPGAVVGGAVSGVPGGLWADINNDGVVDGYIEDGRYFPGAPPGYSASAAPPPVLEPPSPPVAPPLSRSGERG